MLAGGIRDHIGGGFHRYSTDRVWLVPHFEKMLYDNALLAKLYAEAYQITGRDEYRQVVHETIRWMLGEMTDPGGGFYSAQDADTSEGEGTYYTWTPAEVAGSIGAAPAEVFNRSYGVTKNGNFEGRTILHIVKGNQAAQEARGLEKYRSELYQTRLKRPRPSTDTKVLTSWNGLAISALAYAGSALEVEEYLRAAARASEFILEKNSADGHLFRRYAGGEAALDGTLEDYAFFVQGLLDLFEASPDPRWLEEAVKLTKVMVRDFEDKEDGGYFFTTKAEPMRMKEGYDGPTPSGNSVAALDLIRISELTGNEEYKRSAEQLLKYFSLDLEQQPTAHACMLTALDLLVNGVREVVILAPTDVAAKAMVRRVAGAFLPGKVLLVATKKTYERLSKLSQLLEGRKPAAKARGFVCQNYTCLLPADTPEALRLQLGTGRG
jgi:uncharacterized protein YyaL (SSP411 family)